MPDVLVRLRNVSRNYSDGSVTALDGLSLTIEKGEYLALTGPSGSGKSTLLHVICGLDHPTIGEVEFEERHPASPHQWSRLRSRRIGLVFQSFNLLPTLTARENVEVPMFGVCGRSRERAAQSLALLERVGLAHRLHHRPGQLSGGERQRLAIARALANAPDLLLADEPTGNLDSKNARSILDLLEELRRERGVTLVIVTHDAEIASRARRVVRLLDGRLHSDTRQES